MVLSYTVPCHRRIDDWRLAEPVVNEAATVDGGVEVVLVDYGNPTPLDGATVRVEAPHYHMAHARNVAIQASTGDVVIISSTDILPHRQYFSMIRRVFTEMTEAWARPQTKYLGVIAVPRAMLLEVGGYDERFEFYGPEDKDLSERLERRYGRPAWYPDGYLDVIRTPDRLKVQGYRLPLSKVEMHARGRDVLVENRDRQVTVVNQGRAWGSITPPS